MHPFLLKYGINHATIQPEFDNDGKDSETQQRSLAPSTEPESEEQVEDERAIAYGMIFSVRKYRMNKCCNSFTN